MWDDRTLAGTASRDQQPVANSGTVSTADPAAAAVTASEVHSTAELLGERAPSTRRYWIAGAVIFLLLTTAVIWTTWHEPDEDTVSPQQVTQPQSVSNEVAKPSSP